MNQDLAPGDRVLWAGKNGTVRHGTIVRWQTETGTWFVEIEPDRTLPGGDGFRTWFTSADLIKVESDATDTCKDLVYVGGWDYVEPCGNKLPCPDHGARA